MSKNMTMYTLFALYNKVWNKRYGQRKNESNSINHEEKRNEIKNGVEEVREIMWETCCSYGTEIGDNKKRKQSNKGAKIYILVRGKYVISTENMKVREMCLIHSSIIL